MKDKLIFVFGSNLLGIHGKGAAKTAQDVFGAVPGCGLGRSGSSYAIATKKRPTATQKQMSLQAIEWQVKAFLLYAEHYKDLDFYVTRIGCGLAGYKDEEIAPFFRGASRNVYFESEEWGQVATSEIKEKFTSNL